MRTILGLCDHPVDLDPLQHIVNGQMGFCRKLKPEGQTWRLIEISGSYDPASPDAGQKYEGRCATLKTCHDEY